MTMHRLWTACWLVLALAGFCLQAQAERKPKREQIEWLDVWLPNTNREGLPRVLLIGNSITRQYYPEVEKKLAGQAFVARLSTSKSLGDPALLKEVALILSYHDFDIVHFNNGMHGFDYTEDEYIKAFPKLLRTIRKHAPRARLIWAHTTPVRTGAHMAQLAPRNERVKERNRRVADCLKGKDVAINDLYQVALRDTAYYDGGDGIHLRPSGVTALAEQVAAKIGEALRR